MMSLRRLRLACLVGALLGFAPAIAKILGDDDRTPPGPAEAGIHGALGLIVCSTGVDGERRFSAGTGTVVGSRSTVLTSAHVLIDETRDGSSRFRFDPVAHCVFQQFDALGNRRHEIGFSHAEMGAFWTNAGRPNQDWAVLRTSAPLPEPTRALRFAVERTDAAALDGLPIKMLAYHADRRPEDETERRSNGETERRLPDRTGARRPDRRLRWPLLSRGILFTTDYGGFPRLAHTADSERMSSGAALIHTTDEGVDIVVGVNRSSAHFGDFNLGVPLSIELREVLMSHADGGVPLRQQRLADFRR